MSEARKRIDRYLGGESFHDVYPETDISSVTRFKDDLRWVLLTSRATDGPHEIGEHRRWLARQLTDSKLTDAEAYSIVRHGLPKSTDA